MENEGEGKGTGEGGCGDDSETGLVTKKEGEKSPTGIGASLSPDYKDKEESNNNISSCLSVNGKVPYIYTMHTGVFRGWGGAPN